MLPLLTSIKLTGLYRNADLLVGIADYFI